MRAGNLRVTYWALDADGRRAELLASVDQDAGGRYPEVLCTDVRPIEAVLELRDGDAWRAVRTRAVPASATPRRLPMP